MDLYHRCSVLEICRKLEFLLVWLTLLGKHCGYERNPKRCNKTITIGLAIERHSDYHNVIARRNTNSMHFYGFLCLDFPAQNSLPAKILPVTGNTRNFPQIATEHTQQACDQGSFRFVQQPTKTPATHRRTTVFLVPKPLYIKRVLAPVLSSLRRRRVKGYRNYNRVTAMNLLSSTYRTAVQLGRVGRLISTRNAPISFCLRENMEQNNSIYISTAQNSNIRRMITRKVERSLSTSTVMRNAALAGGLLLFTAGCEMMPHPEKQHKGGEDAYYIASNGRSIGVADGMGQFSSPFFHAIVTSLDHRSVLVGPIRRGPQDILSAVDGRV